MHALNNFMAFWSMLSKKLPDDQAPHESFNSVPMYALAWVGGGLLVGYIMWRVQQATAPLVVTSTDETSGVAVASEA
jgi:hypothetical protein